MKKIILILIVFITSGCDLKSEITALSSVSDTEKVWVFSQFNVPEEADDVETYFYYGKVSKNLLDMIKHNKINTGFILLENVKYWGNNDLIYDYKDLEHTGELVFRIEDIVKIDMVNKVPVIGESYEQFEEQSIEEPSDEAQLPNLSN